MTYGGYPKVVVTDDIEMKIIILKDLYETMLLKDVARTFSIDDIRTLEDLTRYLSLNIGNVVSYDSISRDIKITFKTLKKYLDALEKNYILSELIKLGFSPKYWRSKSKAEVDFIVEEDNRIIPIEVKLHIGQEKIGRSLHSFIESYKPKNALVVSYRGPKGTVNINGCAIAFTDALHMKDVLLR